MAMTERIRSGDVASWHAFLEQFSRLILAALRQNMYTADDDDIHTVYVELLEVLYDSGFSSYNGKSSLSTWLTLITRSRALDWVRKKKGRRRLPEGHKKLDEFEQQIFRLFYIEGVSFAALLPALNWEKDERSVDDVAAAIGHIEEVVDPRYLKRRHYEQHARIAGADTGRELEFLIHARDAYRRATAAAPPDAGLLEEEKRDLLERVEELKSRLSDEERTIIDMKFGEGLTAKEIAERLEMEGPRRVYTVIERVLRRMQGALREGE
jgi:RNA polymerase sigma factor (sigma-70 family)